MVWPGGPVDGGLGGGGEGGGGLPVCVFLLFFVVLDFFVFFETDVLSVTSFPRTP